MPLSDPKPFTVPLMETMTLVSGVNGSEYEVRIGLPWMYPHTDKAYPVFVVLDGEGLFDIATMLSRIEWATSSGPLSGRTAPIPEFIVVAIALPDAMQNPLRRNLEFTPPTRREEYSASMLAFIEQAEATYGVKLELGGAANFLRVIEEEILPGVAQRYRVAPGPRMLFGHSAGGGFAAYTLLTRPELFSDYIIASAGFVPDIFRREAAWAAAHKDLSARVLVTAGLKELNDPLQVVSGTARFVEALRGRNYPSLTLSSWMIPDAAHAQSAVPSIVRGLSTLCGV